MEGGRGTSWSNFEETAQKNDALIGWPSSRNPLSPTAGRLCREDMAIYGEEPALDSLSLVVCVDCGRVVKSQALVNHKEQYHSKKLDIPIPHPLAPYAPPMPTPHTVGLPSSAVTTTPTTGGVRGFTASDLPSTAPGKTGKEFDPNRHCGVWIEEEKRQCVHSLNCKIHSLEDRQAVTGRSKPLDVLLKERRLKKKTSKLKHSDSGTQLQSPTMGHRFDLASPPSGPSSSGHTGLVGEGCVSTWTTSPTDGSEEHVPVDMDSFPKPLAACSFSSRSMLKGCGLLLGRHADNLRATLATLSGRSRDYSHTTLHRKHSYNSLSRQRPRRKYYNHRQHCVEASPPPSHTPLTVPPQPHPPPHTPSHPLASPLTASTVLTNMDSLVSLPSISNPLLSPEASEEYSITPNTQPVETTDSLPPPHITPPVSEGMITEGGDTGFLNHAPGELVARTVESMDTEPPVEKHSSKSKKSKSRRSKRRKHKQKFGNQDSSTASGGEELQSDNQHSRQLESNVMSSRSDQLTVNGALSDSQLESERGEHSEHPVPVSGNVRVKEEPVSDQEDLATTHRVPTTKSPSVGLNGLVGPSAGTPAHHTFNSVNSPQSFVINPSRQLPGSYPLVTTIPHVRGMLPLPGMAQNTNLFQSQQHPRFPLTPTQTSTPAGTTSPLHPGLQSLQRQFMQQNAALLLASNPALLQQQQQLQQQGNLPSPSGFINLAAMNRTAGQPQKSPSIGGAPSMPQLHHVAGSSSTPGKNPNLTPPMLTNFQLSNRTSPGGNKIRAPISHIPSTAQRNLPQLSSLGQTQSIPGLHQSALYHHGKQATPPASASPRFPSQVT